MDQSQMSFKVGCPRKLSLAYSAAILILCIFHILQQVWRWLHETKHSIKKEDRPPLLLKFKSLVYSETRERFRELYDGIITDEVIKTYPSFVKYMQNLDGIKESWALCYRTHLLIRGHNTNNNAEAQFLVIRDIILQRVKEFNIVSLFDKLVVDFNDYYKNKLLSVASSSFDGNYRHRFVGKLKEQCGIGYKKPSEEELKYMEENLVDHGHDVFSVPSANQDGTTYLVDLDTGTCVCPVGVNGAPCKHQYSLWVLKKGTGHNFLPIFSPEEKKRYAEIAIGTSLPIEYYTDLHDVCASSSSPDIATDDAPTYSNIAPEETPTSLSIMAESNILSSDALLTNKRVIAANSLTDFCDFIEKKLPHVDSSYLNGLIKFTRKVKTMSDSKATSVFHLFGSKTYHRRRIVNRTSSVKKRAQKGNITVQPEAVKRRIKKNGSRKATRKGKPGTGMSHNIPVASAESKRKHEFSQNVSDNHPVSKKAGRSMASKTKNVQKK